MELLAKAHEHQLLASIAIYVITSLLLYMVARKCGADHAWWAWVPILDLLLMFDLAHMSWLWIFALCVPLLNIIVIVMVWWNIAETRGKPGWLGLIILCPLGNWILLGYLALSD